MNHVVLSSPGSYVYEASVAADEFEFALALEVNWLDITAANALINPFSWENIDDTATSPAIFLSP